MRLEDTQRLVLVKAGFHKERIVPDPVDLSRYFTENVVGSKASGSPSSISEIDIAVLPHELQLLAKVSNARLHIASPSLREQSLTVMATKPLGQRSKCIVNVVRDAFSMGTRVIHVKILVHFHDEVSLGAIRVGNIFQSVGRSIADVCFSRGPVVSWEEDHLSDSARPTDCVHDGLYSIRPCGDVRNVMGFIHGTEDDPRLSRQPLRYLSPDIGKLGVRDIVSALADDASVPTSIIVDIHDAVGSGGQAIVNEGTVLGPLGFVNRPAKFGSKILPSDGETEESHTLGSEVVHLTVTVASSILSKRRGIRASTVAISIASEVKASDVYASQR